MTTTMQKAEIERLLKGIIKEMHPYYEEIKPVVFICGAYIYIGVNYDKFGKIATVDGQLVAMGDGIEKKVDTIEDGIRTLVKSYFRIY